VLHRAVCCSVLQRTAVCCSVLQCVAVCCRVLQCVAVCCSVILPRTQHTRQHMSRYIVCIGCQKVTMLQCAAVCCSVLQCAAVCCSVILLRTQYARQPTSRYIVCIGCQKVTMLQCVAACVLPCVAVCCSVLQRDPPLRSTSMATSVALHCVSRVSENPVRSTVYYHTRILTPYTTAATHYSTQVQGGEDP